MFLPSSEIRSSEIKKVLLAIPDGPNGHGNGNANGNANEIYSKCISELRISKQLINEIKLLKLIKKTKISIKPY